jgi:hypothetical protein
VRMIDASVASYTSEERHFWADGKSLYCTGNVQ